MRIGRTKSALIGSAALAAFLLPSAASAQQRNFELPAQAATKSIPEFAHQAGIQITAPGSKLRDLRTNALKGTQDVRSALTALLEGTGLQVVATDGATITLGVASTGEPTPAAPRRSLTRVPRLS